MIIILMSVKILLKKTINIFLYNVTTFFVCKTCHLSELKPIISPTNLILMYPLLLLSNSFIISFFLQTNIFTGLL